MTLVKIKAIYNNISYFDIISYQVVEVWVFAKEGFALFLLTAYKVFYVNIKTGRRYAVRALSRLLTLLKQQSQEREEGVSVEENNTFAQC